MPPTIVEIMERVPGALVAEKAEGIDAVVHLKFTGAEPGEWNAVIRDGVCHVAQGLPKARPTVSLKADSADFIRIVAGELDGGQAVMAGKVTVSGDVLLAPRLLQLFRLR